MTVKIEIAGDNSLEDLEGLPPAQHFTDFEIILIKNAIEASDDTHDSFRARDLIMQKIGAEELLTKAKKHATDGSIDIKLLESFVKR